MMLKGKKILIQGAGRGHLGLINSCKRLGIKTVVTGMKGNYPCIPLADKFIECDIRNKEGILEIAKQESVDGIIICCSDTGLESVGYVNDKMHLSGITEAAAKLCSDKLCMKERLVGAGVRTAKFYPIKTEADLNTYIHLIEFPMILKATDLQGSRGIFIVNKKEELYDAYNKISDLTNNPYCVLEKYISGKEFGAQAFISNGEVLFVLPHGDEIIKCGTNVPVGHYMPYDMSNDMREDTHKQVINAINALGLDNCAVNIDLIEQDGKVYIIELTGRVGANCLPELASNYWGIDYYEMILEQALGGNPKDVLKNRCAPRATKARMVKSDNTGIIKKISIDTIECADITMFVGTGSPIKMFKNSNDAIGQIVTRGETLQECDNNLLKANKAIKIELTDSI